MQGTNTDLGRISNEYAEKFRVAKLNIDTYPDLASKYGIRSIPTLILFKDGKPVDRIIGALPKETIIKFVNEKLEWRLSA